jgi:phosphatidyl-myo-inositol alpha-mannosyltransferase
LSALTQPNCVGVSVNTQRANPFVRHVIPNGVDTSVFFPDPAARADRPTLVFVGALGGRKRGGWLLEQFGKDIRPHHPDAELHMVCEPGPSQPGVVYHTGLGDTELAALYRYAWLFASPSTYEGFGLPYIEAMASGTPVVATPNSGSREVLGDGTFGRLPSDEQFAPAVRALLADAARRELLVRAGVRRASELSLERTLDAYESLLQAMVTSGA